MVEQTVEQGNGKAPGGANAGANGDDDGGAPAVATIVALAARGDGRSDDGRHVPFAAPGDRITADGRVLPGPNHATPPCRHFGDCGGCQLQHVADGALLDFARDRILGPLAQQGIVPERVMPVHMSPAFARRRAALRATRTKGEVRIGFNALREHRIVDLGECHVLHPDLFRLFAPLRRLLGPILREGDAIAVTMTRTAGGIDLVLGNRKAPDVPEIEGLVAFARAERLARLSLDGPTGIEPIVTLREPCLSMGGVAVALPPAAFLQATADGEEALVNAVLAIAGDAAPAPGGARGGRVADLFSGCGTFSLPLAVGRSVLAVDGARAAIAALDTAARRANRPITIEHRDLFRNPLTAAELGRFDCVAFDPPRAGAEAQAHALAASKVRAIAAISCNPATFARDAAILAGGGYRLRRLWPVAQFRWSTHVELVAEFRRDGGRG